MHLMIAGGGTGGHLFPGLAVVEAFRRRRPDVAITWVGTAHGLEAKLQGQLGGPLRMLRMAPMKGRGLLARGRAFVEALLACVDARALLRTARPDLVIGVGGYAAGPLTLVAALQRRPTVVIEQNRMPGLTNRVLGRFARRICVTYPDSIRFFPKAKTVCTGNPVRPRVMAEFTAAAERNDRDFVLLVFGGSQGARAIDTAVAEALPYLRAEAATLRVIHQIGQGTDPAVLRQRYAAAGIRAECSPFIEAMGAVYRQADLVICRGGSSSLTELTLVGRPAIVIPYPFAADDHQRWNARYFADTGAAILCEQQELSGERLANVVRRLMADRRQLARMAVAMRSLAQPDAAERIVEECCALCA